MDSRFRGNDKWEMGTDWIPAYAGMDNRSKQVSLPDFLYGLQNDNIIIISKTESHIR